MGGGGGGSMPLVIKFTNAQKIELVFTFKDCEQVMCRKRINDQQIYDAPPS